MCVPGREGKGFHLSSYKSPSTTLGNTATPVGVTPRSPLKKAEQTCGEGQGGGAGLDEVSRQNERLNTRSLREILTPNRQAGKRAVLSQTFDPSPPPHHHHLHLGVRKTRRMGVLEEEPCGVVL